MSDGQVSCTSRLVQVSCTSFLTVCHHHNCFLSSLIFLTLIYIAQNIRRSSYTCNGISNNHIIAHFPQSLTVRERILKIGEYLVRIWTGVAAYFFWPSLCDCWTAAVHAIDVINVFFYVFFIQVTFFTLFNVFIFFPRFLFKKRCQMQNINM